MDGNIENTDWTTVSSYPPIAEYAFLSDCEVTALVAPSGNVEWMCLPRMDGPSIFGAILDRDAGGFRFGQFSVEGALLGYGLVSDTTRHSDAKELSVAGKFNLPIGYDFEAFGRVDVLVNNAGINPPHQAPFLEMSAVLTGSAGVSSAGSSSGWKSGSFRVNRS